MTSWPARIPVAAAAMCGAIGLGLLWPVQAHESHAETDASDAAPKAEPIEKASENVLLPGVVVIDARRDLRIVAGQDGVVEAPPGGFALPGQKVTAGQVLARLRPAFPQPERRDLGVEYAGAHRDALISRLQVQRFQLDGSQPFDIKLPTPTLQLLADYRSAQVREKQLKRALHEDIVITAPRAGIVVRSAARAGEVVVAGQSLFDLSLQGGLAVAAEYTDGNIDSAQSQKALTVDRESIGLKLVGEVYDPDLRLRRAYYAINDSTLVLSPGEPVQVVAQLKAREAIR